ncbi:MAG: hypothetical protein ACREQY_09450 [Candidatus Binatia bacterium]
MADPQDPDTLAVIWLEAGAPALDPVALVELGSHDWLQSITSTDGGASWSAPTVPFGVSQWGQSIVAGGSLQDMGWGRQWLAVESGEVGPFDG